MSAAPTTRPQPSDAKLQQFLAARALRPAHRPALPSAPVATDAPVPPEMLALVSVQKAAEIAGVHEITIYRRISRGTLRAFGYPGTYRIRLIDLLPPIKPRKPVRDKAPSHPVQQPASATAKPTARP